MLLHSVENHPWLGKLLFDSRQPPGKFFRGFIKEVSDDGKSNTVYVAIVSEDEDGGSMWDYCFEPRTACVTKTTVHLHESSR